MSEITHRGCKELLFQRMLMAVASSILVQIIFMSCVVLITNLNITSPLSWIEDTLAIITCFRMWCYFTVLATIIVLQGIICSKNYLNKPPYAETRFTMFYNLFTPHNFMVGTLYLTIGIVLVWLHLSLKGDEYNSLTTNCTTIYGTCLVEEYLFLIIGGLWTGIHYFIKTNIFGIQRLQFPIIPQTKFTQISRGIGLVLPVSMIGAIWPCLYYLIVYYFLGSYIRGIAASMLFINVDNEPLDQMSKLLNISLIFHLWLYATLFALTMNSMFLLFQVYLTEWMPFVIGPGVYNTSQPIITLSEALAMKKVPIIQYLGYLDLVTLAQKEKSRRSNLFTLSQPGGHPYNWNCIIVKSLELINEFAKEIDIVCCCKQTMKKTQIETINYHSEHPYVYHMRNLASPVPPPLPAASNNPTNPQSFSSGKYIMEFIKTTRRNFINYLLSKPIIFYFFGTQYDAKINHLLNNGQPVIWAVDGLSSLAVASLTEDPYGIVQKDLPGIIDALVLLKQSLEKLHKMNILSRKPYHDDKDIRQMLTSLRAANRRSIYRIIIAFKEYIDDLILEQPIKDQLQNFFVCKE